MIDTRPPETHPQTEPVRPLKTLAEAGTLKIPEPIRTGYTGEAFTSNRLTGIPEKNDGARNFLASRLGLTMTAKDTGLRNWACLYGDLDQLKMVNDRFGRDAGDAYIKWGVTTALTTLSERVGFSHDALVVPVRQGTAADELIVWMYRLKPDEIRQLKKLVDRGQFPTEDVQMVNDAIFPFSSSYGLVTSVDHEIQAQIETTRSFLETNSTTMPWDFYNEVERRASTFALEEKIAKELTKIPITELFQPNHIDEFIGLLTTNFGGGRISSDVLEILFQLQSIKAVSSVAPEKWQAMLTRMGVTDKEIEEKMQGASSAKEKTEILVGIFRGLFGSSEDDQLSSVDVSPSS